VRPKETKEGIAARKRRNGQTNDAPVETDTHLANLALVVLLATRGKISQGLEIALLKERVISSQESRTLVLFHGRVEESLWIFGVVLVVEEVPLNSRACILAVLEELTCDLGAIRVFLKNARDAACQRFDDLERVEVVHGKDSHW